MFHVTWESGINLSVAKTMLLFFYQALDTLGNTKWRVNKRVLGVIDRIWASGGGLADLVDREDVDTFYIGI